MSDEKPDVPPPRYTEEGGWKRLICDEQEWLARPAPWGIDRLPDEVKVRKQNLFSAYNYGWLARFVECAECRSRIQSLFTDTGGYWIDDSAIEGWNIDAHSAGACDVKNVRKAIRNHRRGVITHTEMINNFISELHDHFNVVKRAAERTGTPLAKDRLFDAVALALELIGPNPFRPITFAPEWRTDTAVSLARGMYDAREFGAMPILADALQDAGCDSDDILNHCRDPQARHVRGCWVVDLVLGKT